MKLESQIRTKAEEQRKSGQELDSTCQICLKTKFADGIGHLCNYCNVRCCARCGGKVALRSSKVRYLQKKYLATISVKVEKNLKGNLDLIPSPSVKNSNYGREKIAWGIKARNCWMFSTNFRIHKVSWHQPAMFWISPSSKLSRL